MDANKVLHPHVVVGTINMRISYDPTKRQKTLAERGLDFEDAPAVFSGLTFEVEDTRRDYGETRILCFGHLAVRLVVIGYTPRGAVRHVFSMRKANEREQARIGPTLEVQPSARGRAQAQGKRIQGIAGTDG
jgi:uncharacterized DUF497 family protein